MLYSIIVPVYNRPKEIVEFLESLHHQTPKETYEVIVVDDGSTPSCKIQVFSFLDALPVKYYYKENTGPGDSRNFGVKKSLGRYVIFTDSDCVLPPCYLSNLEQFLEQENIYCFGGRDMVSQNFNSFQKAVNYAMTSLLTTGGLRGHKSTARGFQPRSFNMGVRRDVYKELGGFLNIHPGEDPELVLRIKKKGYQINYVDNLTVYHKRRINWRLFCKQMYKFGMARTLIIYWHPDSQRMIYWVPFLFSLSFIISILLVPITIAAMICFGLYFFIVYLEALITYKNVKVAILSIPVVLVQFLCYGYGFIRGTIHLKTKKKADEALPTIFLNQSR